MVTYHRATDPVVTPAGRAIFWGYWPDRTMGKVRMEDGRFRSFMLSDIKTVEQACVEAVRDCFAKLDARLAAIDTWNPLDSDEPAKAAGFESVEVVG